MENRWKPIVWHQRHLNNSLRGVYGDRGLGVSGSRGLVGLGFGFLRFRGESSCPRFYANVVIFLMCLSKFIGASGGLWASKGPWCVFEAS